jgi:predicted Zn-dependent protease
MRQDRVPMSPVRILAAAVALLVAAWFAIGVRQAIDTDRAAAIIAAQQYTTAARARHAESLLDDAAWLNPDRQIDVLRTQILLERGRELAARRVATSVTRAEPQNLEGWLWLAHASGTDPALFYYALHRVRLLEPAVPAP